MKSDVISTTPTSSSMRINRRVRTSVVKLSGDTPESALGLLSYTSRYVNHVWTQGQLFLDGPSRTLTFAWNETYPVDMKPIYQERMKISVLDGGHIDAFCVDH